SGILDFREVVKNAARERGMGVLVSSHILSEVQNLCDTVAFINDGVIKSVESVVNNSMKTEKDVVTLVTGSDKDKVMKEINALGFVQSSKISEKGIEIILESDTTSKLIKALVKEDLSIDEIYKERRGLEQRYMELVEGGIR
ncbi:MAG: ABC transporter ATP-binding protein, partial [Clostridium sp.]